MDASRRGLVGPAPVLVLAGLTGALALAGASVEAAAQETGPGFSFPVACAYGQDCFIQNYVDHDPGPGRLDHACGRLSYDGHDGTDIRLATLAELDRSVPVLAAAAGEVLRTRDGMADLLVSDQPPGALAGREAGNGVVIDHGNGWETQYSHLQQGSVLVSPGEPVQRGQPIGAIGLSGNTEFPHVEFSVRHGGQTLDPFTGTPTAGTGFACGTVHAPLWTATDVARLVYLPSAGLAAGFATEAADSDAARTGQYTADTLPANAPALVFWADVMGAEAGDRQHITIIGPDGDTAVDSEETLDASNVSWFAFAGRRTPSTGWPPGPYRGRYTLSRDGAVVVSLEGSVTVR